MNHSTALAGMHRNHTQPSRPGTETVGVSDDRLDEFFAAQEHRAYLRAKIATRGLHADSLDIVQESMLSFVNKRYERKPREQWAPLFQRIVQNKIMDWHRRQKVRNGLLWFRTDDQPDPVDSHADPRPDSEQATRTDQANQALIRALEQLPPRQQQVFLLRAWEELDTRETAAAMGISEGSVKTHYARAIHRLREKLGEHWP